MPITFNCPCGKVLRVADENAGRRVKCPACQAVGNVPAPEPDFEVVEDAPEKLVSPPASPKARPAAKAATSRDDDDDDDDGRGYTVANTRRAKEDDEPAAKKKPDFRKSSRRDDDEDDEDDEPKKKKKKRSSSGSSRGPSDPDAGKKVMYLIGGALMVLAGIVLAYLGWQSEGRSATRGLIFGICLAVVGVGTAIKGITGNFDE